MMVEIILDLQEKNRDLREMNKELTDYAQDLEEEIDQVQIRNEDSVKCLLSTQKVIKSTNKEPVKPKKEMCIWCSLRMPFFAPSNGICHATSPEMEDVLNVGPEQFEDARWKMNKHHIPESFEECEDPQFRLMAYLSFFRTWWGYGKIGKRKKLPECVVDAIRKKWPLGFSDSEYNESYDN